MVKLAMVGLGKMGLSHLAIARAHPKVDLVAGCDASTILTGLLSKHTGLPCVTSYDRVLETPGLQAVIIATPSRLHGPMIRAALERDLHVFCEKPFVLDPNEGDELAGLAERRNLVNQVGYHYRFVGAFRKAADVIRSGGLGRIHHVRAEAYGPVVLRAKGRTWRSSKSEGGGALYDYACHAVDLVQFVFATPTAVSGVIRNRVFSADVDDEVYCSLHFPDGCSGQLSVNWSDESHRKMSTQISLWGTNGRVVADRQECRVYLRRPSDALPGCEPGWTTYNTTELSDPVGFYLRGEEYSAQIDHFVNNVADGQRSGENSFRSAAATDRIVARIAGLALGDDDESGHSKADTDPDSATARRGFRGWLTARNR